MALTYQHPSVPRTFNDNSLFLEMPDAPYSDSSSSGGFLRPFTDDFDLEESDGEDEELTPAQREFIYCLYSAPPAGAESVPRYMPPSTLPPAGNRPQSHNLHVQTDYAAPSYGYHAEPHSPQYYNHPQSPQHYSHQKYTYHPSPPQSPQQYHHQPQNQQHHHPHQYDPQYSATQYASPPYSPTHSSACSDFQRGLGRHNTAPQLTVPRTLPFSAPPEPGSLSRRWTEGSHTPCRLLYRSLNGESRTVDRRVTGVASPLLLLQHWAIEIGERGNGYRIELEYVGMPKLSVKSPEESAADRKNYQHAPKGFRSMTQGFTGLAVPKIIEMAEELLKAQGKYKLGSADCRRFAIDLLNRICDDKNAGIKNLHKWETFFGGMSKPMGTVATSALKKMGLLGGGGFL